MLFADLNKLKIVKNYSYETETREIVGLNVDDGLRRIKNICDAAIADLKPSRLPVCYRFVVDAAASDLDASEHEMFFETVLNVLLSSFFGKFCLSNGRPREYRLSVPEGLDAAKIEVSLMKKAINHLTCTDIFNIIVEYKDMIYIMCDTKGDESYA